MCVFLFLLRSLRIRSWSPVAIGSVDTPGNRRAGKSSSSVQRLNRNRGMIMDTLAEQEFLDSSGSIAGED